MKLVILACLATLAAAAPQFQQQQFQPNQQRDRPIAILRDEREDYGDGNFRYEFETENGILVNVVGAPGSQGQSNIQGFYRYPQDDGTYAEVRYIADEYGYQPESDLLPVAPPMPQHAIDQIRFAEEQRAAGVTWDQYGFRLTR